MNTPTFDLVDIVRTIQKQRRIVILITAVAVVLGGVFLLIKKKKFKAEARFLVNNPLYGDRNNLFRSYETRYVDYFGGDDDLDKVTSLANSDTVKDRIIRNCQFQIVYNRDINTPKGHASLMEIFNKNFNLKRSEYKDISVSYVAYDSITAANVANMSVKVLEETYQHYYSSMKEDIYNSIHEKVVDLDSAIDALTDTLAGLREKHGIYSIISPTRQSMITGEIKGNGKDMGRAIEVLQNIASIKDQLVTDRARYISNLNEFSASGNKSMTFLKVITRALPPTGPSGPGVFIVLAVAAMLGFFFSVLYVLLVAYFRKVNAVIR
jgi:capsular polysaccharide biosynthesis protein